MLSSCSPDVRACQSEDRCFTSRMPFQEICHVVHSSLFQVNHAHSNSDAVIGAACSRSH